MARAWHSAVRTSWGCISSTLPGASQSPGNLASTYHEDRGSLKDVQLKPSWFSIVPKSPLGLKYPKFITDLSNEIYHSLTFSSVTGNAPLPEPISGMGSPSTGGSPSRVSFRISPDPTGSRHSVINNYIFHCWKRMSSLYLLA